MLLSLQGEVCGIEQPLARAHVPFMQAHLHAAPQDVGFRVRYWTGSIGRFWPFRTGAMQDCGYELPRIVLLGISVNKGKKRKGEGL
jgi:hypothetical protein